MSEKDAQRASSLRDGDAASGADGPPPSRFGAPTLIGLAVVLRLVVLCATTIPSNLEYRGELTNSLLGLPYSTRSMRGVSWRF